MIEKEKDSRKTPTSALLTMKKPLIMWITTNCGKLTRREYQTTLPAFWEICMQVKKQQVELNMEQQTGSNLGKEYIKAVYCHLAYKLICRVHHVKCPTGWSTSWTQDCWEKYQELQICRRHHLDGRNWRGTKEPLDERGIGEWNIWFKLHIQKMKIMAFDPITSWQIDGETMETVTDFIFRGSKITADCDCSYEIKRHLLLRRKAITNIDSILKCRDITLLTKPI